MSTTKLTAPRLTVLCDIADAGGHRFERDVCSRSMSLALEASGWVRRWRRPRAGRAVVLSLTDLGAKVVRDSRRKRVWSTEHGTFREHDGVAEFSDCSGCGRCIDWASPRTPAPRDDGRCPYCGGRLGMHVRGERDA